MTVKNTNNLIFSNLKEIANPVLKEIAEPILPTSYFSINTLIHNIEKLHSIFFKFIDCFLVKKNICDINSKQLYFLYLTHKDGLPKIQVNYLYRYYKGTNVSYNLKLMVNSNYITNKKDNNDKRSHIVSLTKKAKKLVEELDVELNNIKYYCFDEIFNISSDFRYLSLCIDNVYKDILKEMERN
jgi:DNA-binding MarR family transcriptional regulator